MCKKFLTLGVVIYASISLSMESTKILEKKKSAQNASLLKRINALDPVVRAEILKYLIPPNVKSFICRSLSNNTTVLPIEYYIRPSSCGNPYGDAHFNAAGDKLVCHPKYASNASILAVEDKSYKLLKELPYSDLIISARFNTKGDKVATGSETGKIAIWSVESGKYLLKPIQVHKKLVASVQFNTAGNNIVTASEDGTAKIWDVATGKCLQALEGHKGYTVLSAQFNHIGNKIVTASCDGTAKIWDVVTGNCLQTLNVCDYNKVYSAQFNHIGNKIVTASGDNTAKIWDVVTGNCLQTLQGHTDKVGLAQFNKDGDYVLTSSWDNTQKIWDVNTGKILDVFFNCNILHCPSQFDTTGDKVLIFGFTFQFKPQIRINDISPHKKLYREMTAEQSLLLRDINEVIVLRRFIKLREGKGKRVITEDARIILSEDIVLDLKAQQSQETYESLPNSIKKIFNPYVIKSISQLRDEEKLVQAKANLYLGEIFLFGDDYEKNYLKARVCFEKALELHSDNKIQMLASARLARMHCFAQGVEIDLDKIKQYLNIASSTYKEASNAEDLNEMCLIVKILAGYYCAKIDKEFNTKYPLEPAKIYEIFNPELQKAVTEGYKELVDTLIECNVDLNVKNSNGRTPLHSAVIQNNEGIVRLLLKSGASKNIKDNNDKVPLDYALEDKIIKLFKIA